MTATTSEVDSTLALQEAVRWLRDDGFIDLCEIAESPELTGFWRTACEAFEASRQYRAEACFLDGGPVNFILHLLYLLRTPTLKLPEASMKEKRDHRAKIAKQIHKLRHLIQADDDLASLSIPSWVEIAGQHTPTAVAAGYVTRSLDAAYQAGEGKGLLLSALTLAGMLEALQNRLEQFEPLHYFDLTKLPQDAPQNRAGRERIRFERRLAAFFERYTGRPQSGLIADAYNAVFAVPEHQRAKRADIEKRLASRPSQVLPRKM